MGVGTREVNSTAEALTCLRDGALMRSTASTNMNDSSSRSHAVFTLHIFQQRLIKSQENEVNKKSIPFSLIINQIKLFL